MRRNESKGSRFQGKPDISIILTVFNTRAYLREAIESVFAQQTSSRWELLIVDDGSTDGGESIAEEFAARFPACVRVLRHAGGMNRGISASRNLALRSAEAPVTAFLDSDDVWLEHRLESQLPLLLRNPRIAMVYAQAERWYDFDRPYNPADWESGRNFVPPLIPAGERGGAIDPPKLLQWFLEDESMTPCTCTVLVRTDVARRLGGFVRHFTGLYDDQVFYAKVALGERIFVSLDCVARYRQHPESCCARAREAATEGDGRTMFLEWLAAYRRRGVDVRASSGGLQALQSMIIAHESVSERPWSARRANGSMSHPGAGQT